MYSASCVYLLSIIVLNYFNSLAFGRFISENVVCYPHTYEVFFSWHVLDHNLHTN